MVNIFNYDSKERSTERTSLTSVQRSIYKLSSDGKYIWFGEYPQTVKAENVTVGTTADIDGYYLGSDGERYAKVTATPYDSGYTFSTGASVTSGTVYYFKVEPIKWRILSKSNGKATVLCESIIANKAYQSEYTEDENYDWYTTANGASSGTYANNYKYSEIRAWLNEEFYNTAFTALQKEMIEVTAVDNSASTTWSSSNSYACENTQDKVWLLSCKDTVNTEYGFSSSYSEYDTARRRVTSDYSRATGAWMDTDSSYYGNGWWWLRSPSSSSSDNACGVNFYGYSYYYYYVYYTLFGVVPALIIRL